MLQRPQAPFPNTWLFTRAPASEMQAAPRRRHSPNSVAAVLPKANKVGPVCRRHASATSHHLPGSWAQSIHTERQLPLTMRGKAALPRGRWQQGGEMSAERKCEIAGNFRCSSHCAASKLNEHTRGMGSV